MSGTALSTLNTVLQTGICTLQMLILLQQKQAGDYSLGLSLLCQQSWDTAVMPALRNVAGKFWHFSGSNEAWLCLPCQWRRLCIFIASRLFIPKKIWWDSGVSARGPQIPLPPSNGRGEAGANGSRPPPKNWSLQHSKSQREREKSVLIPFKQETLHLIQQEWEQMSHSDGG